MPEIDIHDSPAAQAERDRQLAAERARRYRQGKKEEGKPDTKAVDQAIVEALSFQISLAPETMTVDVDTLTKMATLCLKRDGYRKVWARMAVVDRMRARPAHDDPTAMPSRRLTETTRIIQPPGRGEWTDADIALVRSRQRPARDGV